MGILNIVTNEEKFSNKKKENKSLRSYRDFIDAQGRVFQLSNKCSNLLNECNVNYEGPDCYTKAWKKCKPPASKGEKACKNSRFAQPGWLECPNFVLNNNCNDREYGCEDIGEQGLAGCPTCDNNTLCSCDIIGKKPFAIFSARSKTGQLFPSDITSSDMSEAGGRN